VSTYASTRPAPYPSRAAHAHRNFIVQQGFAEPAAATCERQYSSLLFQPRLIAFTLVAAATLEAPFVFFAFGVVLWWSALLPRLNPFDALYNWALAPSSGVTLSMAPAPRRFSQFLGGSLALAIEASRTAGLRTTGLVLEVVLLAGVGAVVFVGFCTGSWVFHVLRGRVDLAMRTVPWATVDRIPVAPPYHRHDIPAR